MTTIDQVRFKEAEAVRDDMIADLRSLGLLNAHELWEAYRLGVCIYQDEGHDSTVSFHLCSVLSAPCCGEGWGYSEGIQGKVRLAQPAPLSGNVPCWQG